MIKSVHLENKDMISLNSLTKHKDDNFIIKFARATWYLHLNTTYKENVKDVESGNNEYYKSTSSVPLFTIHREFRKIGYAFPRVTKETNTNFLFIPKTSNKMLFMGNKGVSKQYYIFDVDDDHMPKYKAKLMFFRKSRMY